MSRMNRRSVLTGAALLSAAPLSACAPSSARRAAPPSQSSVPQSTAPASDGGGDWTTDSSITVVTRPEREGDTHAALLDDVVFAEEQGCLIMEHQPTNSIVIPVFFGGTEVVANASGTRAVQFTTGERIEFGQKFGAGGSGGPVTDTRFDLPGLSECVEKTGAKGAWFVGGVQIAG